MTGRVLAEIAIKSWAILWLAQILATVPSHIVMLGSGDTVVGEGLAANVIVGTAGSSILALSLLMWGRNLAQWLLPDTPALQADFGFDELAALCLTIVGVVLLVDGIGGFLYVASERLLPLGKEEWQRIEFLQLYWVKESIVRSIAKLVCGATLIVGRARLTQLWSRLRGGL